jgi:hypothetical protein
MKHAGRVSLEREALVSFRNVFDTVHKRCADGISKQIGLVQVFNHVGTSPDVDGCPQIPHHIFSDFPNPSVRVS